MLNRHARLDAVRPPADGLPDVGLYIDDERSIAAVSRPSRANPSLHIASLHSTVLYVHTDGSASLGGTDDPNAAAFRDFVGAEVDSGFEPGDLVAMAFRCLLAEVAASVGTDTALLAAAATFPPAWTAERVSDVRTAMNRHGLDHVALVSETEALAAWAATTHATWAGKDSGIAAARGAATVASNYPVEAVTEKIQVAGSVSPRALPVLARTPVLAAVALAAVLALGGGVASLVLQNTATTEIPEIEGAPVPAPTTTPSTSNPLLPFPTVVPIAETYLPPAAPSPVDTAAAPPSTRSTAQESPRTRPASDTETPSIAEETTPEEVPAVETPGGNPDIDVPPGEPTGPKPTDPTPGDPTPGDPTPGDEEEGEIGGVAPGDNPPRPANPSDTGPGA